MTAFSGPGSQIEEVLQTNCIATLPSVKVPKASSAGIVNDSAPMAERTIVNKHGLLQYVVDLPLSRFTEGLRSLKVVMDLNGIMKSNKVIGFTSTLPDEGKSTIASNFAHLLAHAGRRTILIDSDLRNPSLSRRLVPDATVGLVQVIAGKTELRGRRLDRALDWVDCPAGGLDVQTRIAPKF